MEIIYQVRRVPLYFFPKHMWENISISVIHIDAGGTQEAEIMAALNESVSSRTSFAVSASDVEEDVGRQQYWWRRNGLSAQQTIRAKTRDGSATAAEDYTEADINLILNLKRPAKAFKSQSQATMCIKESVRLALIFLNPATRP